MITVNLSRVQEDYGFAVADEYGHTIKADSSPESGGKNFGFRPMQLLLAGLASCSSIDVVSILKKQKQNLTDIKVKVSGEREPNKEPSLWKYIIMEFDIFGDVDLDKANRAADLSINKYCSVAATLKAAGANIEWVVKVHKD